MALAAGALVVPRRVQREYAERRELSGPTAIAVWMLYLANIGLVVEAAARRRWPLPLPPRAASAVGWGLCAAGSAFATSAIAAFRSFELMNGMRTDRLVTEGPYRISQHPQNVGWALALAGGSLASRSAQALAGSAAMWASFATYAPSEEDHLRRAYDKEYEGYAASTPRFLGLPGSGR